MWEIKWRLLLIALSAFLWEVVNSAYIFHFNQKNIPMAMAASLLFAYVGLLNVVFMIEAKNNWQRFILATAEGIGFCLATGAVMLFCD